MTDIDEALRLARGRVECGEIPEPDNHSLLFATALLAMQEDNERVHRMLDKMIVENAEFSRLPTDVQELRVELARERDAHDAGFQGTRKLVDQLRDDRAKLRNALKEALEIADWEASEVRGLKRHLDRLRELRKEFGLE
jgi:multidrug resistance efflux pump